MSVPRPWQVQPGQYVYITLARPGLLSIFQRHPFMVSKSRSNKHTLELRIQVASGFTRDLLQMTSRASNGFSAFIEGPYGKSYDLRNFGTVVLFASGIGIVAHLPYIQELVADYRSSRTKTRDLLLVWEVDHEHQRDLVWDIMNDVLRGDDLPMTSTSMRASTIGNYSKESRKLGYSSTADSPGMRPNPHGENVMSIVLR